MRNAVGSRANTRLMNNPFELIRKEAALTLLRYSLCHLPRESEKNQERYVRVAISSTDTIHTTDVVLHYTTVAHLLHLNVLGIVI